MSLAPYLMQSRAPELVKVCFRFQIDGTNDPNFVVPAGFVTDVTRSSAGVFVVTMRDKYPVMIGFIGNVMNDSSSVNDLMVRGKVGDYVASTGVLTVTVIDAGTAAAADPSNDSWVYLELTFCRKTALAQVAAV